MCVCMSSHVSSRVWRILSRAYILYKWLCFCVLYCTVLYRVQYLYFKLDLQKDDFIELLAVQHKELTNEDLMELEAQRKDEERQEEEEVTEEPKRFTTQEMAREFSLFEEALLVFEAQEPNAEWYTKVAAAVQNAI